GPEQLLGRRRAVLERLLGVVRHLDRNRLEPLRQGTKRRERRVHVVLPELLHVLEVLDHGIPFPDRSLISPMALAGPWCQKTIYCTAQKCQALGFAAQKPRWAST